MKKVLVWFFLVQSFWVVPTRTMQVPSDQVTIGEWYEQVTMRHKELEDLIHKVAHERAQQAMYNKQASTLWHYTKKGALYGGIAIGVYFGVKKILGMPSMAHVRATVDGHVSSVREYIGKAFGSIGASLKALATSVEQLRIKAQRSSAALSTLAGTLEQEEFDLTRISGHVDALVKSAQDSAQADQELDSALQGLITAICRKPSVKEAILRDIEARLQARDLPAETRRTLTSLQEKIHSFEA